MSAETEDIAATIQRIMGDSLPEELMDEILVQVAVEHAVRVALATPVAATSDQ